MNDKRRYSVAVVGATGAVGRELIAVVANRGLPLRELRLLASTRSAGMRLPFDGESIEVRQLTRRSFDGVDVALFSAGSLISREFAPHAVTAGAMVIDNSSAFRMDPDVPLVVPEINAEALGNKPTIVANPNCSTIIALMAVAPLHRAVGVERMVVATYQAASGGGAALMRELEQQVHDYAAGRPLHCELLGKPYLFNVFSHNSAIGPDGYNEEETKLVRETHKILDDDSIGVTATCVRVPVLRAHCEAINLTLRRPLDELQAREILGAAPGVRIVDDRAMNRFPEPIHASGKDDVLVGRIRADGSQPPGMGLNLFVVGDQLRKGAALNAVQIAEVMLRRTTPTRSSLSKS